MHDLLSLGVGGRLLTFLGAHRVVIARGEQHQPGYFLGMLNRIVQSFQGSTLGPAKQMDLLHTSKRADEIDHPVNVAHGHVAMYGSLAVWEGGGVVHDRRPVLSPKPSRSRAKVSHPARAKWRIKEQLS